MFRSLGARLAESVAGQISWQYSARGCGTSQQRALEAPTATPLQPTPHPLYAFFFCLFLRV